MKPRTPITSYFIFLREEKARIAEKYNTNICSQIAKFSAIEWKNIKPEDLDRYNAMAMEGKNKYRMEMKEYKEKY